MVERLVRNEKVRGSTPLGSTILIIKHLQNIYAKQETSSKLTSRKSDVFYGGGCISKFNGKLKRRAEMSDAERSPNP